jgi:hypothetical protein
VAHDKIRSMLVLFQPDAWTIVNSIAGTISALAALVAVIVAVRAMTQGSRDHQNEIESKHPRFVIRGQGSVGS